MQLILHVRKFFCTNRDCPRKIFAERLTAFLEPWARVTTRLGEEIEAIGLASCGRLGARLGSRLRRETSRTSILRRVMKLPTKTTDKVLHLGVDDFSFRRGRTFGTVLVDLQLHQILDLLPDRQKETAAAWMKKHPEITHVSRDRGKDSAAAAKEGAPQAIEARRPVSYRAKPGRGGPRTVGTRAHRVEENEAGGLWRQAPTNATPPCH